MKFKIFIALFSFVLVSCTTEKAKQAPPKSNDPKMAAKKPNRNRPCETSCAGDHTEACKGLILSYDKCNDKQTAKDCTDFLARYSRALPKSVTCESTCSEKSYLWPLAHVCSDFYDKGSYPKIYERSAYLLVELKFEAAKILLLSKDFRKTLDGAVAEGVLPEIEKLEKARK